MSKLKMLCVHDGEGWVDALRFYETPCNGSRDSALACFVAKRVANA